jgi:hypothetical protein
MEKEYQKDSVQNALLGLLSDKKKTPESTLLQVLKPKIKEVDENVTKKLVSFIPKKEDPITTELIQEISSISSELNVKRANALGLSLVNLLKKSKTANEDPIVKKEIQMRFGDIIGDILQGLVDEQDEKYEDVYQLAVGSLYKYLNDDLKKILRKQKDVMDGKIAFYKDEPLFAYGSEGFLGPGIGGGGGDAELEKENAKLKSYINILETIYQSDIISYINSPYQINYNLANVILIDASEGNIFLTMPNPLDNIGKPFVVKKIDTTINTITILPYNIETFEENVSISINSNNLEYVIYSIDGISWTVEEDIDIIGLFLLGELIWSNYSPTYEWSDFNSTVQWSELDQKNEFRRPRTI